jgi:actin-related protein
MGLAASAVVLTGGNFNIPGMHARFEQELRQFVPDVFDVNVYQPPNPELYAWKGADRFVQDFKGSGRSFHQSGSSGHAASGGSTGSGGGSCAGLMVTREDYLEYGHDYCNEQFTRF